MLLLPTLWACAQPGSSTPQEPTAMSEAPPLSPSGPFMAWLEAHPDTVVLPFSVARGPLGLSGAELLAQPPVPFSLDDTTLGISLADRLRDLCPEAPCHVWLEGTYGTAVPLPGQQGHVFTVRGVRGVVEGPPEP